MAHVGGHVMGNDAKSHEIVSFCMSFKNHHAKHSKEQEREKKESLMGLDGSSTWT